MSVVGFQVAYSIKDGGPEPTLYKLTAAFERAGNDLPQFGEWLFPALIPLFEDELGAQFVAEGHGPKRGHWAPLTPKYAEQKRKKYGVRPILIASGKMAKALTESGDVFAQRVYNNQQLNFGTMGVPYASFHQTGTARMVDRPVFDWGDAFAQKLRATGRVAARKALRALNDVATVNLNREADAGLAFALGGE